MAAAGPGGNIANSFGLEASKASAESLTNSLKDELKGQDASKVIVTSMDELQKKYPKFAEQVMTQWAKRICDELRKHSQRMKEIMRKNQY